MSSGWNAISSSSITVHSSMFVLFTNYPNRKNQYAKIYATMGSRDELMTTDHNSTAIIRCPLWSRLKSISFSCTCHYLYSPRLAHIAKVSYFSDSWNFVRHNTRRIYSTHCYMPCPSGNHVSVVCHAHCWANWGFGPYWIPISIFHYVCSTMSFCFCKVHWNNYDYNPSNL